MDREQIIERLDVELDGKWTGYHLFLPASSEMWQWTASHTVMEYDPAFVGVEVVLLHPGGHHVIAYRDTTDAPEDWEIGTVEDAADALLSLIDELAEEAEAYREYVAAMQTEQ